MESVQTVSWEENISDGQANDPADEWGLELAHIPLAQVKADLLTRGFSPTIVERGMSRVYETMRAPEGYRGWVVRGDAKKGDLHGGYQVVLDGRYYKCACYTTGYGPTRSQKVCSHVVAVIMARRSVGGMHVCDNLRSVIFADVPQTQPIIFPQTYTPRDLLLPYDTYYRQQEEALRRIRATNKRFIVLQSPPGTGKTLIAASIQRLTGQRVVYTCTTKELQDQVQKDFTNLLDDREFGHTLKGRNAYPTVMYPDMWPRVSAEQCTLGKNENGHCQWCCSPLTEPNSGPCRASEFCPYLVDRIKAEKSMFPILNLSAFLYLTQYGKPLTASSDDDFIAGIFKDVPWLVVDEADEAENALRGFMELKIDKRWSSRMAVPAPVHHTSAESWKEWLVQHALPFVEQRLNELRESLDIGEWETTVFREKQLLTEARTKIQHLIRVLKTKNDDPDGKESWVFVRDTMAFKPVFVSRYANQLLWSKAGRIVLMSGTIGSLDLFCHDMGIPKTEVEFIDMKSTYPAFRRPIFYQPVGNVTLKNKDESWPMLVDATDAILVTHSSHKVMIHTVSYELARFVYTRSQHASRMLLVSDASHRSDILSAFKQDEMPKVLVTAGMERGVDLPGDLCRAIIVLKVPFANLGDPQIAARVYSDKKYGKTWYAMNAARRLVQATGRGMRSEKDWVFSYVLDAKFGDMLKENSGLFPLWWKDAIKRE